MGGRQTGTSQSGFVIISVLHSTIKVSKRDLENGLQMEYLLGRRHGYMAIALFADHVRLRAEQIYSPSFVDSFPAWKACWSGDL